MPHDHEAHHVAAVANALLAAKRGDPLRSACGLALFASVLAEQEDEVARTTVALAMLHLALELCPDLGVALKWH